VLHGLRLSGHSNSIGPQNVVSNGQKLFSIVVNSDQTEKRFNVVHVATRNGVIFLPADRKSGRTGEPHRDKTLSVLGRIGTPSSQVIHIGGEDHTIGDVVRGAQINFGWDQELAFTAVALTYYLPPARQWTNKYGQEVDFDALCNRICRYPLGEGACYGTHNLFALAAMVAADRQYRILSAESAVQARRTLREASVLLAASQSSRGSWSESWHQGKSAVQPAATGGIGELVATSHTLEWIAIAPEEVEFDSAAIGRAIKYLVDRSLTDSDVDIDKNYSPYTHVGTALQAWFPEVWKEGSLESTLGGKGGK
jgi:hypothetical protein